MSNRQKLIGILGFVVVLGMGIENASAQCPDPPDDDHDCACNTAVTRWVCAKWAQGGAPTVGADFSVSYTGDVPRVEFINADDGWEVYSEKLDVNGDPDGPADLGDVLLASDVSPNNGDFKVMIKNGAGYGAVNVSSIVLDSSDGDWTGGSVLEEALISGNVTGAITLVEFDDGVNPPVGGELGGLIVVGDVEGPITIPHVTGTTSIYGDVVQAVTIGEIVDTDFSILGEVLGNIHITEQIYGGTLTLGGNVPLGVTIRVADIVEPSPNVVSGVTIGFLPQGAYFFGTLILDNGLTDAQALVLVRAFFEGTIDLTDDPVAGDISIVQGSGDIINGGAVSGTVTLAVDLGAGEAFSGSASFASITSTGVVQTIGVGGASLGGPLTIVEDMDGLISINNQLRNEAQISVAGTTRGDILIGGNIFNGPDITLSGGLEGGTLTVEGHVVGPPFGGSVITIADMVSDGGGNPSSVDFQQNFGGGLYLNSGIKASQEVRIGGEFTSVDSIVLYNQALAGTLEIVGGGNGSIYGVGAVSGTVILADGAGKSYTGNAAFASVSGGGVIKTLNGADFGGDVTISVDVAGDISVSGDMTSASSVTVHGALKAVGLTGGKILVDGICDGPIQIGEQTDAGTLIHLVGGLDHGSIEINTSRGSFNADGDIRVGPTGVMTDIVFDGCIHIYNDGALGDGALNGVLIVRGCHATPADLDICIDGPHNNNVKIEQTGCTNQVDWSCPQGGCP